MNRLRRTYLLTRARGGMTIEDKPWLGVLGIRLGINNQATVLHRTMKAGKAIWALSGVLLCPEIPCVQPIREYNKRAGPVGSYGSAALALSKANLGIGQILPAMSVYATGGVGF